VNLFVFVCVVWRQVTLLGELGKFVPFSKKRFVAVAYSMMRDGNAHVAAVSVLTATVMGLPGEKVVVTALRPKGTSWKVVVTNITIGADGTQLLRL
jgi:hypothetical protein